MSRGLIVDTFLWAPTEAQGVAVFVCLYLTKCSFFFLAPTRAQGEAVSCVRDIPPQMNIENEQASKPALRGHSVGALPCYKTRRTILGSDCLTTKNA